MCERDILHLVSTNTFNNETLAEIATSRFTTGAQEPAYMRMKLINYAQNCYPNHALRKRKLTISGCLGTSLITTL